MLTAKDIKGVCALPPTPCKEGAQGWDATDSVDLDESARMVENIIQGGATMIGLNGTTGECAALLFEEKRQFWATAVETAKKRVPVFAGCTALGTKETIRQMRVAKDIGCDGAFIGLPLWQTPSLETSIQFFADLSEAVPDMPVMVYSNAMFFKSTFPVQFWAGVARRAPTVVTNKVTYGIDHLMADVRVAGHQIKFMPGEASIFPAWRMCREHVTAMWSTSAGCMGPEPYVALLEAINRDDEKRAAEIYHDILSIPPFFPQGEIFPGRFPNYNAQAEKWRANASGFVKAGPSRAPYYDLPDDWKQSAEAHGKGWAELRKKYARVTTS
ncbi:MAG TPA: dihydrodipicolinate synthase family protein [Dehalococcoidia bacterium]|nr:dihydrodipicolinate synthase family protein [Dehalococcoidia bacterium]